MPVAHLIGKELLDGRENDASGGSVQQFSQIRPVFRLNRSLPEQLPAAGERSKQLAVEVVPVRQDDDRRIFERGVQDDAAGVKGHRQALAGPLRVPDDAASLVAAR